MTLWRRISDGVWVCAAVVVAGCLTWLLSVSGVPVIQEIGFWSWLIVGTLGSIFFGIGALIIIGGLFSHLIDAWRRRSDA